MSATVARIVAAVQTLEQERDIFRALLARVVDGQMTDVSDGAVFVELPADVMAEIRRRVLIRDAN